MCPDGRSYVGSAGNAYAKSAEYERYLRFARKSAIRPMDQRAFVVALKTYPFDPWRFEVIERLPPGCSLRELRVAEQRHIERLGTWRPDRGFNTRPAAAVTDPDWMRKIVVKQGFRRSEQSKENWRRYAERRRASLSGKVRP